MSLYRLCSYAVACCALVVGACDLQPKIASIPDNIGVFIEDRYPALLADPETQPEIYNSAVTDYGVYASPELYGTDNIDDYVLYASMDDYVLIPESEPETKSESDDDSDKEPQSDVENDYIVVPVYGGNTVLDDIDDKKSKDNIVEKQNEKQPESNNDEIIVVRGDTVYALAKKYNMSVEEFAKINDLKSPYTLKIGQKLKIQPQKQDIKQNKNIVKESNDKQIKSEQISEKKSVVSKQDNTSEIIVARGDTVYALAKKYNMSVEEFAKINDLKSPYTLKIGQNLKTRAETQKIVVPEQKKEIPNVISTEKVKQVKQTRVATEKETKKATDVKRVNLTEITVKRGDTLYSLSREYEIPVNDLAVLNKISAPFALSVGQKLKVPKLDKVQTKHVSEVKSESKKSVQPETKKANKTSVKKTEKKTDKKISSKQQTSQKQPDTKVSEVSKTTKTKISSDPQKTLPKIMARSSSKFSWPVRGTILSGYGPKNGGLVNDGINISASAGTVVKAAENGVVAYAGNEIKGMGNLIIIQHSDGWMTVYAHLNSMNVKRGTKVSVGQNIGTVGKTGKVDKPQLHFEIRKGTRSYNPTKYLKK